MKTIDNYCKLSRNEWRNISAVWNKDLREAVFSVLKILSTAQKGLSWIFEVEMWV
jgi:hypothetical protein